jgi:hypothetical protein
MITGFNTDVSFGGCLYHVQTEDRGRDHPFLESLVYVGGTIIAKKQTPYPQQVTQAATDDVITPLLRRQHQVIIAAIKAGRIEELVRHSTDQRDAGSNIDNDSELPKESGVKKPPQSVQPLPPPATRPAERERTAPPAIVAPSTPPIPDKLISEPRVAPAGPSITASSPAVSGKLGLNLDQVVSDYLKRSSEQGKLDVKVQSPKVFTAGNAVALKVLVTRGPDPESEAIVTVKVIGTAFKPQVFMSRADRTGLASFNFSLPAFSAGTAAIVIEAQSNRGRGELKQLIRRT